MPDFIFRNVSTDPISLNVVLGNGLAITVNEKTDADLQWAMRGAGHNFDIVISFELNICPVEAQTWYKNYVFTGTQFESLFQELDKFQKNGSTPKLILSSHWMYTF